MEDVWIRFVTEDFCFFVLLDNVLIFKKKNFCKCAFSNVSSSAVIPFPQTSVIILDVGESTEHFTFILAVFTCPSSSK